MKQVKFLLSTLSVAIIGVAFSACGQNAAVNNTTTANAVNQSNTATVVNSNSTTTNTASSATSSTASNSNPSVACDVTAYVTDKDPKGLNVRDSSSESGKVIGQIPFNKESTVVHIVSSSPNGWVMIDKATITTANADKAVFDKKGWVSANLLEVATRGYDAGGVNLLEAEKGSKVLTKIPEDTVVKITGCSGNRMQVKYKNFTGWLEPDSRCDSSVTRCN